MKSEHLVDPELRSMLSWVPDGDYSSETLRERRAYVLDWAQKAWPGTTPAQVQMVGDVPLRIQSPAGEGLRPAIYYIHGGGFVCGSAEMCDGPAWELANEHGAVVASVGYRLAPETRFPGPLEDCYAGLVWLFENAAALRVDPKRVVIFGGSAGGGLAAALALLNRDRKGPVPAGQVLIFPMLDCRTGGPDCVYKNRFAGEFIWTPASNRFGWSAMAGGQEIPAERIGHFSPALADDLSGLPPAFISVGALDLFVDESLDYAARLARAGVPVECHLYPGAFHAFGSAPEAQVSQRHNADIATALGRMLKGS